MTEMMGRDKHGHVSSQPVVKSGPNRGKRLPETEGRWVYLCGFLVGNYDQSVVCGEVVRSLAGAGFRLGHHDDDGVRSIYMWRGEHRREEER
jgi:hypothetical protein